MSPYAGEPPPEDKRAVRARLRARRRELLGSRDREADAAWLAAEGLAAVQAAGAGAGDWVSTYESTPSEPPTEALVEALVRHGIRVMVPVTLPDMDLDWREAGTDGPHLGREAIGSARVVFVPAQGVDRHGFRIGQGGGCYDRALPRTSARAIALVHPWEVLEEDVPREGYDQPVDAVLTAGEPVRSLPA